MMKKTLILIFLITVFLTISVGVLNASATSSGTCGTELNWILDDEGTLTISGTGAMRNYSYSINAPWYNNRSSIKKVIISDGVTTIGSYAFYNCDGLTSITIPDSVTTIGESAFYNCVGLTSVTIGNGVTTIGSYAFHNCYSLTSITIPDSVTTIGDRAFYDCYRLTSVTIGNSVTTIGNRAFYDCDGLTSITIPDSVTTIGSYAFYDCGGLADVYYNGSPEMWNKISIGDYNSALTGASRHYKWIASGTCGTKLNWILDDEGTLTISGTGAMADYAYGNAPWYNNRSSIKKVIISDGVTTIGFYAFFGCSKLTSVTIPDSVTTIGVAAFYDCDGLTSIAIPDSVTTIGVAAFYDCDGLTSITIPDSVTTIGKNAFDDCDGLTSVTIGNSVTTIGNYAFYDCGLTSVTIGNSVTTIGAAAFFECDDLTSIAIPDSVTTIGDYAFSYCNGLTNIEVSEDNRNYASANGNLYNKDKTTLIQYAIGKTDTYFEIPDSVTTIGNRAFSYCDGLTSVTIPDSVTTIGYYAFSYCSKLTSVTIPDSVTTIGEDAFRGCAGLTEVYITDLEAWCSIEFEDYDSNPLCYAEKLYLDGELVTDLVIPDSVTTIGNRAFEDCDGLTSITIPDSVTTIGNYAFDDCDGLTSVTIPDSVTTIGYLAFYDCYRLASVTIGNSVTTIGNSAFYNCDGLTSVTIPDNVTTIGYRAFYDCDGLTSVTIGNGVTSIGDYAFRGCAGLTSITIPDSVTTIGNYAFSYCSKLTSITIGNSVTTIGDYAFDDCDGLADVYYNGNPEMWNKISIGDYNSALTGATRHYKWIASGTCGDNLSWLLDGEGTLTISGTGAMADYSYSINAPWYNNRSSIKKVIISDGVTTIGSYAFYNCDGLTSITIPDSVTTIGSYAFYDCAGLTSVTIPDSVTTIGSYAFYDCDGLTSITIGNSVTSIGNYAFDDCDGLADVYYNGSPQTWSEISIGSSNTKLLNATRHYKWIASGTCGDNLSWLIDIAGTLTISGTGAMADYASGKAPWYNNRSSIKKVSISDGVTTIGRWAFYDCDGLTSVTIPDSVTTIGSHAFYNCDGLTSVTIGNSVTTIGSYAFYGCTGLTSVTIPDSVTTIGDYAFYDCDGLADVYYNGSPEMWNKISIGDYNSALTGATRHYKWIASGTCGDNLSWLIDSEGILTIRGDGAMADYSKTSEIPWYGERLSVKEVVIEGNITHIAERAFYGCVYLEKITIPNSVTSVGTYAFRNCDEMTIYAEAGSFAETYANENDITFVNTKKEPLRDISVEYLSTTKKMYFDITVEDFSADATVYAAIYDTNGVMLDLVCDELVLGDITSLSVNKNANASYVKIFVWKDGLIPVTGVEMITDL